ncbi:glycosyltransferase family 2 protein [Geobacter sulfurreducens]|uniref:glycosyltransferase family 2 protein n=1 Tax=Geobacter sulfurreducens TaxID=35554 RepID=UPI002027D609|nr:glycosyltransferase family 2 protein [Geobacter sulfurreducens]
MATNELTAALRESVCLDDRYATTRAMVPLTDEGSGGKMRENAPLRGGLRTRGYGKVSKPGKPVISVITPVFNGAGTLEDSMLSVLSQRYDMVEYLVIDGGSTDGTLDLISKFDEYIDYWESGPDSGIYDAMNKGLELARGDWIIFLGCDDILLNCFHAVAPMLQDRATVYYGDVYMPASHKLYGGKFDPYKLMCRNIPHQAMFYPRLVVDKYRYDLTYRLLSDYHYNIRCFNDPELHFHYLPILVSVYNDFDGLTARSGDPSFEADKEDILRAFFPQREYLAYRLRTFLKRFEKRYVRGFAKALRRKK